MTAHALYTQTLSEYKSRLISSPCLTLRSYCHECHVNYHGMELWLSRHGIRIRELRSSLSASSSEKPVPCFSPLVPSSAPSARPSSSSDMLYGINITFPDGVIISIKQGSSFGIHRLLTFITVRYRRSSHVCFNRKYALLPVPALCRYA